MQRICSKQRLDELRTSSRDSLPYPVDEPPLVQKCRAPGYSGGELNLQPSLWFMAAICCFSASATAFLEAYVLSASGHLAVFLVGGYVVFSSYFVCDYGDARAAAAAALPSLAISPLPHRRTAVMMRVSTSYAAIPDAKKFYVLSNLVKARRTAARPAARHTRDRRDDRSLAHTLGCGAALLHSGCRPHALPRYGQRRVEDDVDPEPGRAVRDPRHRLAAARRAHGPHHPHPSPLRHRLHGDQPLQRLLRTERVARAGRVRSLLHLRVPRQPPPRVALPRGARPRPRQRYPHPNTLHELASPLGRSLATPPTLPPYRLFAPASPLPHQPRHCLRAGAPEPLLLALGRYRRPSRRRSAAAAGSPRAPLSAGALVIYTSCLAANWAWQVHYLTGLWVDTRAYSILAYVGVILLVVWDDVVLVKWLVGNLRGGGTKSASAQQQQQQQQKRASGAAPAGKEKPA